MRIAAYVRVSTDEQADKGNSIHEQQERLGAYCKAMGWDMPEFFIDDGYSAKNLKRPAITKLLESVRTQQFDVVLATKLDRMCRNLLDLLQLVEGFEQSGCRFVSASESFDTSTAAGRMTLHLLGMFAEFERERISERVKDNMLSLARNTDKALVGPCFGYDLVEGNFAINEAEAEHVRFMFDLAEQGHGTRYIAKALNDRGVLTKRGKQWESSNVKRLIKNIALIGSKLFNMRKNVKGKTQIRDKNEWLIKENSHPAIISAEQFETVQQLFESRRPTRARAESESYLLTGLVHCKRCGSRMKGHTARHKHATYYRYLCAAYVLKFGCSHHYLHRADIEQFVINQIKQVATASDNEVMALLSSVRTNQDEIADAKNQLARIDKRMQKQIEAYENDLISASDLKKARERIESERSKLTEHIQTLESRQNQPNTIRENIAKHLDDITGTDRLKAKKSMSLLIDRIEVDAPAVSIIWRG